MSTRLPLAPLDGSSEALVSVRDYGPGIAAEHLPRLTERFYRADVGESRAQGGTGLGLALVKHILNRHRGRLTIDSREGEGATFTVRLPTTGNKRLWRRIYIIYQCLIMSSRCHRTIIQR